jgi:hypothetical protein
MAINIVIVLGNNPDRLINLQIRFQAPDLTSAEVKKWGFV